MTNINLYEALNNRFGSSLIEIFGDTGTGKTTFAIEVCKSAIASGKKVFWINADKKILNKPQCGFAHLPNFRKMEDFFKSNFKSVENQDLIIWDSLGLYGLAEFSKYDTQHLRGKVLLKLEYTGTGVIISFNCHCIAVA